MELQQILPLNSKGSALERQPPNARSSGDAPLKRGAGLSFLLLRELPREGRVALPCVNPNAASLMDEPTPALSQGNNELFWETESCTWETLKSNRLPSIEGGREIPRPWPGSCKKGRENNSYGNMKVCAPRKIVEWRLARGSCHPERFLGRVNVRSKTRSARIVSLTVFG